jgi:hypothetical protein
MIYDNPLKDDEGFYFVKALRDDKKKYFVQLNKVRVVSVEDKEVAFDLANDANLSRIQAVDTENLQAAVENSEAWFGKALTEDTLTSAYTPSVINNQVTADRIGVTKVFTAEQELVDFDALTASSVCTVLLEFAGLWFAKKAYGPVWNIVQVKVTPPPPENLEVYPEDYAIEDEE